MRPTRAHPYQSPSVFLIMVAIGLGLALPALGDDCYTFVTRWGQTGEGAFVHPSDIAVDREGSAYVAEGAGGDWGRVKKFTPDGSKLLWEKGGSAPLVVHNAWGVAVDSDGHVYVSDTYNNRVVVCRAGDGGLIGWYGGCDDPAHAGLGHWHAPDSTHVPVAGAGPGQFLNVLGVDVDAAGCVYFVDQGNYRIQVFRMSSDEPGGFSLNLIGWFGGCDQPSQHQGNDRIHAPDSAHHPQRGSGNGFLWGPCHLAVTSSGYIYVTDGTGFHDHRPPYLLMFATDGRFVREWNETEIPYGVFGIAVDADGCLQISNPVSGWIAKYTSDISLVCRWAARGFDPGLIDWPLGLAVDGDGIVYVTDSNMRCVQVFEPWAAVPELYLHGVDPDLTLDDAAPTGTVAKYKDSPSVNRTAFKEIGTWTYDVLAGAALDSSRNLHVWVGLKNSDDQGTYFDIRGELYKNGTLVASGETMNVQGITRNPDRAKEVAVAFGTVSDPALNPGDVLSLKILTKVTATGGHSSAVGLRLYYDSLSRPSRFEPGPTP